MRPSAIALILLVACSPNAVQLQARIVDDAAKLANVGGDALEHSYEVEGEVAMQHAVMSLPAGATPAEKGAAADAATAAVRKRWASIWKAWQAFADAEKFYATSLETGGQPKLRDLEVAYCSLLAVAPDDVREKLTIATLACELDGGAR